MKGVITVLALACVLAGCGGGGGLSVGAQTTQEVQIQQNWTKTYTAVGTFTPNGGSATICQGTLTTLCTGRVGTQVTLTETLTLNVSGTPVTHTKTLVLDQAVDGTITPVSSTEDANATDTVQSTTFFIPGTWSGTVNVSGATTYTNAIVQNDSLVVNGTTQIHTPVGAFDTWTTAYHSDYNGVATADLTEYYVPGISDFVYASGALHFRNGDAFTGTFNLRETNVPLP